MPSLGDKGCSFTVLCLAECYLNKLLSLNIECYGCKVRRNYNEASMGLDTLHLLVTSELTPGFLLKVDQNQIFPMTPKFLFWIKKYFTMTSWSHDHLAIRKKVSSYLRYFKPCWITIRWENKQTKCYMVRSHYKTKHEIFNDLVLIQW